jgi:hypothetical protein
MNPQKETHRKPTTLDVFMELQLICISHCKNNPLMNTNIKDIKVFKKYKYITCEHKN